MKRALIVGVAAALMAGCGSDGDGGSSGKRAADPRTETTTGAAATARFRSKAIAFTFEYPKDFAAETRPDGEILGQVSVEPDAAVNAIRVRRTADRALGPERYLDEFHRDFAKTFGRVEKREQQIGALEMGVLEFEDAVKRGDETVQITSASYFFAGAGKTWQVECVADSEHRDEVAQACRAALESVEFVRATSRR